MYNGLLWMTGSIDDTKKIVDGFENMPGFEIQYFKQSNQGKMSAINELVKKADGDILIECDSDDYFKDYAFRTIFNTSANMEEDIYACAYLKYDQNQCNIGKLFSDKYTTMFDLYFKQGEDGEKALVFQSNIRKKYLYELENGEKFTTEARMYHKMDKQYKIKCINEAILICEYQKDGYSKNIKEIFKNNPYGYYQYFKEMFSIDLKGISFKKRLYILKHYILFSVLTKQKFRESLKEVKQIFNKIIFVLLYMPGKIATNIKFN